MSLSNPNTNNIPATNLDNVDLTEPLNWELKSKSDLADDLTTLESSISSGMSSSGDTLATLEVQKILNVVLPISKSQPSNSKHLTTPSIDLWSREVQIEPITLCTKPK